MNLGTDSTKINKVRKKLHKHIVNFSAFLKASEIGLVLFTEVIVGVILSLSSLIIFLKIASEVFQKNTYLLDTLISNYIYSFRNPFMTDIMYGATFLGGEQLIALAIILLIMAFFISKKHKREALLFSCLLVMNFLIDTLVKDLVKRPRPDISPLFIDHSYSFPSGHSMSAFVFYTTISYLVFHFTRSKKWTILASVGSVVLILLIGFSRVYLGVHYPSDVLAGFIGGFWLFVTVIMLDRTMALFKLFKEHKKNRSS